MNFDRNQMLAAAKATEAQPDPWLHSDGYRYGAGAAAYTPGWRTGNSGVEHQVNGQWQPLHEGGFGDFFSHLPVIGDVLQGAHEVFGRPGDMFNNPGQFFGKAAAGAAPFLGGVIGPWAKIMGAGGHLLENPNALRDPMALASFGLSAAGPAGLKLPEGVAPALRYGLAGMNFLQNPSIGNALSTAGQFAPGGYGSALRTAGGVYNMAEPHGGGRMASYTPGMAPNFADPASMQAFWQQNQQYAQQNPNQLLGGQGGRAPSNPAAMGAPMAAAAGAGGNNFFNQFTDPFGFKLFGGGPYADRGYGDKQVGIGDTLQSAGNQFLQTGTAGLPNINNMGMLGMLPGVVGQQAALTGVQNPFTGQGGQEDPFSLNPVQQHALNTQNTQATSQLESTLGDFRNRAASMGITDPTALASAEARIRAEHGGMVNANTNQAQQQAYQTRLGTLQNFSGMIPGLYEAQNARQIAMADLARNFLAGRFGGAEEAYGDAAKRAMGMSSQANQGVGQAARWLFGPGGPLAHMGVGAPGGANGGSLNLPGGGGSGGAMYGPTDQELGVPTGNNFMPPSDYGSGMFDWMGGGGGNSWYGDGEYGLG